MNFQLGKDSRKSLALTIYNDFAAVKEVRMVKPSEGIDVLRVKDLPGQIEIESFFIKGLSVLEQSNNAGPPSREGLLNDFIGRVIVVRNWEIGRELKVRLLKAAPDLIVQIEETGEMIINPSGDIVLPSINGDFNRYPDVSCRIIPVHAPTDIELHYLTQGLKWEAYYTAELVGDHILLEAWMNIINFAGVDFENAKLKVIAGSVKRAMNTCAVMKNTSFQARSFPEQIEEYGFSDANVFKLDVPFSIAEGQSRQIRFLSNQILGVQKVYRIEDRKASASIQLLVAANSDYGLNFPLPKGTIKFYERDKEGDLEFIGEDWIDFRPASEKVLLKIGETSDIASKAREKNRIITEGCEYVTYEYQVVNNKQNNVGILIDHIICDELWEMESSTHDYELKDSRMLEFHMRLGAGRTVGLEFTYKVKNRTEDKYRI